MSRFWDWALLAYERPGVAQACLALQDEHGQCTPYLLWAAWAAQAGRGLDEAALRRGQVLALRWDADVLQPVRSVRRLLKPSFAGVEDGPKDALRQQIKTAELACEQTLMAALEAIVPAKDPPVMGVQAQMEAASRLWSPAATPAALSALSLRL